MRQAFSVTPAPGTSSSSADVRRRLAAITAARSGGTAQGQLYPTPMRSFGITDVSVPSHQRSEDAVLSRAAAPLFQPSRPAESSTVSTAPFFADARVPGKANIPSVQVPVVTHAAAPLQQSAAPSPPPFSGFSPPPLFAPPAVSDTSVASEDVLTQAEMEALRVVELDATVRLFASASTAAPSSSGANAAPPLTLISEAASVKVFPRHLFFSQLGGGAPLVELVIQELVELTEDAARGSLLFTLRKASGVSVVEVVCPSAPARSALYKLVCAKRGAIGNGERGAAANTGIS